LSNFVATIGFFDGVHLGHRYLISQVRHEADIRGLQSAVITFRDHPKLTLTGQSPALLTTYDERIALLKTCGLNELFCFEFDVVRSMTAREFMQILHDQCGVRVLLMGYDHRFGSDRPEHIEDYQSMGQEVGLQVIAQQQAPEGDVSSTKVRRALMAGDVEQAKRLLGYSYTLSGTVVHGRGIGRQLGYPTANLSIDAFKLIPLCGVYAAEVLWQGEWLPAILNIGSNPTVGNSTETLELHIPNLTANLYDEHLTIHLLRRLRDEQKFDSLSELQEQIGRDIRSLNSK